MKLLRALLVCSCLLGLAALSGHGSEEAKYGDIEVVSEPIAAEVYIEGFSAGKTPLKVEEVPPGEYRIVVKKDSFDDFVQDLKVTKGEVSRVQASLGSTAGSPHSPVRSRDDWTHIPGKDRKLYQKAKSKTHLGSYKTLELSNFLIKTQETVPPVHLYSIFPDLAAALDEKTKFARFVTKYTHRSASPRWTELATDSEEPTLILSGGITEYQGGSRSERYLLGPLSGEGATIVQIQFRLVDKATNEVLLERIERGAVTWGLFGGSSGGAMKQIAGNIAKAIEKNW